MEFNLDKILNGIEEIHQATKGELLLATMQIRDVVDKQSTEHHKLELSLRTQLNDKETKLNDLQTVHDSFIKKYSTLVDEYEEMKKNFDAYPSVTELINENYSLKKEVTLLQKGQHKDIGSVILENERLIRLVEKADKERLKYYDMYHKLKEKIKK